MCRWAVGRSGGSTYLLYGKSPHRRPEISAAAVEVPVYGLEWDLCCALSIKGKRGSSNLLTGYLFLFQLIKCAFPLAPQNK